MSAAETFNSMGSDSSGDVVQAVGTLPPKRAVSTIFSIMVFAYLTATFFGSFTYMDTWSGYFFLAIPSILIFISAIVYTIRFLIFVVPCQLSFKTRKNAMIFNFVTIGLIAVAILIQLVLWIVAMTSNDVKYGAYAGSYVFFGFFGIWTAFAMLIAATVLDFMDAKSGGGASSGGRGAQSGGV